MVGVVVTQYDGNPLSLSRIEHVFLGIILFENWWPLHWFWATTKECSGDSVYNKFIAHRMFYIHDVVVIVSNW